MSHRILCKVTTVYYFKMYLSKINTSVTTQEKHTDAM